MWVLMLVHSEYYYVNVRITIVKLRFTTESAGKIRNRGLNCDCKTDP